MERIQHWLNTATLSPDESQLVIYLRWLLSEVGENERERCLTRIRSRDTHELMEAVCDAITKYESMLDIRQSA